MNLREVMEVLGSTGEAKEVNQDIEENMTVILAATVIAVRVGVGRIEI